MTIRLPVTIHSNHPALIKRLQHDRIRKFTADRIACMTERHGTDISLSPPDSPGTSYRSIRACALDCFARLPRWEP